MPELQNNILDGIDALALEITQIRQKPLLVLYYPEEFSTIRRDDISDVYDELTSVLGAGETHIPEIDILLHTYGGDPNASYRIIQAVREIAEHVNVLVPFHAYSGGTLICLGAEKILLGAYAALSPIDISLGYEKPNEREGGLEEDVPCIFIDKYVEFTRYCKDVLEKQPYGTKVEEPLLLKLVDEIGVIKIAEYFRERELTKYYANVLLMDYMFKENPDKSIIGGISDNLVFQSPSHDFEIDYNIAIKLKLQVERMPKDLSDKTKMLIRNLEMATQTTSDVCMSIEPYYRMPYIRLYARGG